MYKFIRSFDLDQNGEVSVSDPREQLWDARIDKGTIASALIAYDEDGNGMIDEILWAYSIGGVGGGAYSRLALTSGVEY